MVKAGADAAMEGQLLVVVPTRKVGLAHLKELRQNILVQHLNTSKRFATPQTYFEHGFGIAQISC